MSTLTRTLVRKTEHIVCDGSLHQNGLGAKLRLRRKCSLSKDERSACFLPLPLLVPMHAFLCLLWPLHLQGEVPVLVTISGLVMSCLVLMTKCPLVDVQAGYMFRWVLPRRGTNMGCDKAERGMSPERCEEAGQWCWWPQGCSEEGFARLGGMGQRDRKHEDKLEPSTVDLRRSGLGSALQPRHLCRPWALFNVAKRLQHSRDALIQPVWGTPSLVTKKPVMYVMWTLVPSARKQKPGWARDRVIVTFASQAGRCIPCLSVSLCCNGPFRTAPLPNSSSSGEEGGKQAGMLFLSSQLKTHSSSSWSLHSPVSAQVNGPVYYLDYLSPYPATFEKHPSIIPSGGRGTAGTPGAYRRGK